MVVPEDVVELIDNDCRRVFIRSRPDLQHCFIPRWVIVKKALKFYAAPFKGDGDE